jgi:hypothetical protein
MPNVIEIMYILMRLVLISLVTTCKLNRTHLTTCAFHPFDMKCDEEYTKVTHAFQIKTRNFGKI